MSCVSHLECSRCGRHFEPGRVYNLCPCGAPLWVRYDLTSAGKTLQRGRAMAARSPDLWRYREVLPVRQDSSIVCLGEGFTPLQHARGLGKRFGLPNLYLKDESQNPTGSFKARGLALAVSMAFELGVKKLAIPSAGNAGGALAAYAARAGIPAAVYMPEETPLSNRLECSLFGAEVVLVPGTIKDCGRALRERGDGWFDVSTLREPYRLEGKKTMAYEIIEQLDGRVPDAIVYPTGGGTGLIGIWKGLEEMEGLGWIGASRPRMFAVQAAGCAPLVRAFAAGTEHAEECADPHTVASGLRVPSALGDFLILRVVRQSRGAALAVDDRAMLEGVRLLAESEGIITSPEGGATLAGLQRLLADGFLAGYETVVLLLTASGYKYLEVLRTIEARSQKSGARSRTMAADDGPRTKDK